MNARVIASIFGCVAIAIGLFWLAKSGRPADTSQSLRLGTNVWAGYEPLYLARSMNYFDETSVRLVECSSASQVIREFRNNTLEIAALTLDEVLLLKEDGYDVKIILVTDISHGGDVILAKPEIASLKELRGRNVGVEHTALGAYVLTRALQSAGMSVGDVKVIPLEIDEHERAFDDDKIDAVVTFDPVRSRLLNKGAVTLFDSTRIPGEIVDVLATHHSTITNNPEKFSTLLRGWFSAVDFLDQQPNTAGKIMAERLKLDPQAALASMDGLKLPDLTENLSLLGGANPQLAKTAERLAELMVEQKLLRSKVDLSNLFSAEPLNRIRDK